MSLIVFHNIWITLETVVDDVSVKPILSKSTKDIKSIKTSAKSLKKGNKKAKVESKTVNTKPKTVAIVPLVDLRLWTNRTSGIPAYLNVKKFT